ncbi:hypothetical protein WA026_021983 [Henosepilachna vigintioctopunctata]|uniref:Uncharacterized protein n=1 Tax=Henosepilachna vigintioctopunctata TaxID=420089 RepID=A0AAW1VHB5_9CUCU
MLKIPSSSSNSIEFSDSGVLVWTPSFYVPSFLFSPFLRYPRPSFFTTSNSIEFPCIIVFSPVSTTDHALPRKLSFSVCSLNLSRLFLSSLIPSCVFISSTTLSISPPDLLKFSGLFPLGVCHSSSHIFMFSFCDLSPHLLVFHWLVFWLPDNSSISLVYTDFDLVDPKLCLPSVLSGLLLALFVSFDPLDLPSDTRGFLNSFFPVSVAIETSLV